MAFCCRLSYISQRFIDKNKYYIIFFSLSVQQSKRTNTNSSFFSPKILTLSVTFGPLSAKHTASSNESERITRNWFILFVLLYHKSNAKLSQELLIKVPRNQIKKFIWLELFLRLYKTRNKQQLWEIRKIRICFSISLEGCQFF